MKVLISRFATPTQAQLAKLALERAGVGVDLRGGDRAVLVGELPDAGGEVWVDEVDAARALDVLRAAEQPSDEARPEVACPSCAALNPAGFEVCWRCQAALVAGAQPVASAVEVPVAAALPVAQSKLGGAAAFVIAALVLVVIALVYALEARPEVRSEKNPWKDERVDDACVLRSTAAGVRQGLFCDADHDGFYERVESYDTRGKLVSISWDANANGVYEKSEYRTPSGALREVVFDRDEDGRSDESDSFMGGQRAHYTVDVEGTFERVVIDLDGGTSLVQVRTPLGWRTVER